MSTRTDGRRRGFGWFVVAGVSALAMLATVVPEARACGHRRGGAYHYNGAQGYYGGGYSNGGYYRPVYANGYGNAQGATYVSGQAATGYVQMPAYATPVAGTRPYEVPPAPAVYNSAYTAPTTTTTTAPLQEPFAAPPAPSVPVAPSVPLATPPVPAVPR